MGVLVFYFYLFIYLFIYYFHLLIFLLIKDNSKLRQPNTSEILRHAFDFFCLFVCLFVSLLLLHKEQVGNRRVIMSKILKPMKSVP